MQLDIETVLLIAGTVITLVSSFLSSNRGAYDRVQTMIQDATMGEVAEARHIVGTYWAWLSSHDERGNPPKGFESPYKIPQVIDAMFKIVWALRRTQAVYESISIWTPAPKRLLRSTLSNWVFWSADKEDGVLVQLDKKLNSDIGELEQLNAFAKKWQSKNKN